MVFKDDYVAVSRGNGQVNNISMSEQANTLDTMHDQQAICYGIGFDAYNSNVMNDRSATVRSNCGYVSGSNLAVQKSYAFKPQQGSSARSVGWQDETAPTLSSAQCGFPSPAVVHEAQAVYDARGNGDGSIVPTITGDHENRITDYSAVCAEKINRWVVRRLTPLECERLQGYPDGWTDIGEWTDSKGKLHKDSSDTARYKALGNSIALPFWYHLLENISKTYESQVPTLGSLFDGIGGFPLCWETINGKGTAIWASEIEEFCIAVTKRRFPEDENETV